MCIPQPIPTPRIHNQLAKRMLGLSSLPLTPSSTPYPFNPINQRTKNNQGSISDTHLHISPLLSPKRVAAAAAAARPPSKKKAKIRCNQKSTHPPSPTTPPPSSTPQTFSPPPNALPNVTLPLFPPRNAHALVWPTNTWTCQITSPLHPCSSALL